MIFKRPKILLRSNLREKKGNVLMIAGLSLPLLVGGAGLTVDTISWVVLEGELQRTADSAAIAGAMALSQEKSVTSAVTHDLAINPNITPSGTPVIENAPTLGKYTGDSSAVRVELEYNTVRSFSSLFLKNPPKIKVYSTAALVTDGNYCVVSLNNTNSSGIIATGSSRVELGCGIFSNSTGPNAISTGGNTYVQATPVGAVGVVPPSNGFATGTELISYSIAQPDPFGKVPLPSVSGCQNKVSVSPKASVTLNPGCYKGFDFKGDVFLNPGIYYVDGNSLNFGSQTKVNGQGVTFVLTSENANSSPGQIATLNINGGAELNLSATDDGGIYDDLLFYQDTRAIAGQTIKINGNSNSVLSGGIYFPKQEIEFTGTSDMDTDCVRVIGWTVKFSGNAEIVNYCPAFSGNQKFTGRTVRLVE